jgi:hypothetical protein
MAERMIGIRVSISRYVSDHNPGIVECEFTDAHGLRHVFVVKVPIVSFADLDARTPYPQPGVIACEVLGRRNSAGRETILVDTEEPWGVESRDGTTGFEVSPETLIEWDWGSYVTRPWDGRY